MADSNADIRALVDSFVDDLSQHIRAAALEAVRDALLADGAPTTSRAAAPRRGRPKKAAAKPRGKGGKGGKRRRRSATEIAAAKSQILAHIKSNPGCAMGELTKSLGESAITIRAQVNELLSAGSIRKEGERRGTRYFAGKAKAKAKAKAKTRKKATKRKKTARR